MERVDEESTSPAAEQVTGATAAAAVSEAVPDPVPEAVPDPVPEAVPDPVPEAVPDPVPEAAPDLLPEAAPDLLPEAVPDPGPGTLPDPVRESAADDELAVGRSTDAPGDRPRMAAPSRAFRLSQVVSVDVELPDQYPTVVLEDVEEHRWRLRFRIGIAEGVALAHVLHGTRAPRPLTSELFSTVLERFSIEVLAMRLTARTGSTYAAELDLIGAAGHEVVPCRPSDGLCVALAQRLPAPVLVDELLFTEEGDVAAGPRHSPGGSATVIR